MNSNCSKYQQTDQPSVSSKSLQIDITVMKVDSCEPKNVIGPNKGKTSDSECINDVVQDKFDNNLSFSKKDDVACSKDSSSNTIENSLGDDGYLNSMEISSLTLNADMVVLSACNTGFGKLIAGEGILGLQRSFLKAGASSVLVSLWSIYDKSTAQLMSKFYENINLYESRDFNWWDKTLYYFDFYQAPLFDYKAKAIRDAKLSMLKHPYYDHPVYWAPFILIGK